jgi:hypothetical protein
MDKKWFQKSYRRNLTDMHITDWNEEFLSKFDPKTYVDLLELAQVKSAMVYANSHVGNCYWPTKVGHMHEGLKGRDILGEMIEQCHQRGMDFIVYYSLIFNNWAYENNPSWRIIRADGKEAAADRRYGVCCPNSGYRDFAVAEIEDFCSNYDFEGIFFDMTFWPHICYCSSCQERYRKEVGKELPRIVNWEDPEWVKFQRKREEWLTEFTKLATFTAKRVKPGVAVENQFSTSIANFGQGVTAEIGKTSDYAGGDFYGGLLQESFICKLYYNLTPNKPFEFMTSRCIHLSDHTTRKSEELMKVHAYSALANDGAFLFIDAIDPVGTMNRDVYEIMGRVFGETKAYEKYLGGDLCQDVAIYFSFASKFNPADNGKNISELKRGFFSDQPHLETSVNAVKSLLNENIPFGVITKDDLKDLSDYQVIVLPKVLMMDEEEVKALREFVASGGSLYASGSASLLDKDGNKQKDFMLADVLGVSYLGETKERLTYIAPTSKAAELFPNISSEYPLTIFGPQIKAKPVNQEEVLATITLPYTDPADHTKFSSIHSNPPGIPTEYPAVILRDFGKGKVVWVAGDLEMMKYDPQRKVFINLIKSLAQKPFSFEADAPKSVEITLFHQEENKRYIINFLNFQEELPNIPISGITCRVKLEGKKPTKLMKLPGEEEIPFELKGNYVEFRTPELETFLMLALNYEQ